VRDAGASANWHEQLATVGIAALLGGLIGFEREGGASRPGRAPTR
jgi:hypothetical protein